MTATMPYVGKHDIGTVEDETRIDIDALLDKHAYELADAEDRYIKTAKCSDREGHEFQLKVELKMFFDKTFAYQYNGDTRKYREEFVETLFKTIVKDNASRS